MKQAFSALKETNLIVAGMALLTSGFGLLLGWTLIIRLLIEHGVSLKEGSLLVKLWRTNPMPLYLELYTFNWTNPHEFLDNNTKPKFNEIGPFVFKETKTKVNLRWHDHNDTISFNQLHDYRFDREKSVHDLDFRITTINPIISSAAYAARNYGYWMRKGMQISFNSLSPQLHITKTVGEFFFDGYEDIMVTLASKMPFNSAAPPFDKFGWFYGRNNSLFEGDFNMGTKYDNFGVLYDWNYSNRSKYYHESCSDLKGSAGELFAPNLTRGGVVNLFCADMCRTMPLDYQQDVDHSGITGYKYSADVSLFDNGTLIPENACYCSGDCLPSGVVNISSCKYGAPGFVSLPHFYNADPYYVNAVEGMKPNKSLHEFYLVLEPVTGVPLEVAARLQINILIQPRKYFTLFEKVPQVMFPVLWFEEHVHIPTYIAIPLKIFLLLPIILQSFGILFLGLGILLILFVVYRQIIQSLQQQQQQQRNDAWRRPTESSIRELVPLKDVEKVAVYEWKENGSLMSNIHVKRIE